MMMPLPMELQRSFVNTNQSIRIIYQTENQFSQKKGIWQNIIYPSAQGAYFAECEGDDYWCDPNKLQKQVDFLETHPDYSVCVHRCKKLNCRTHSFEISFPEIETERDISLPELILGGGGFWGTNTIVCRRSFLPDYK